VNGLLGLPMRMQERLDVLIGSKFVNGVVIKHRPRVELLFLRQCQGDVPSSNVNRDVFHFSLFEFSSLKNESVGALKD
jgi:hypothetical protein